MTTPRPGRPVRGSTTGRPLMAALDLLGRRWALRVLWELRDGAVGARALLDRCDGLSSSVLYTRLRELEDAGLDAALRAHARSLRDSHGLAVELDVDGVDDFLSPDGQLVVYRIIQEALTNVARHSGTDRAMVAVRASGGYIEAVVTDRGKGFEMGRTATEGRGLGLMGMRERAVMVGGLFQIESRPGAGTRVSVRIPVAMDVEVERV